jgi:hypothetical protein
LDKLAEKLSEVLLVIIPLCVGYFAGIIYLSTYLSNYSINIHEFDLSVQLVLTYSFSVFYSTWFVSLVLLALLAYVVLQTICLTRFRARLVKLFEPRLNMTIGALAACFASFVVVYQCAHWSAVRAAELVWKGETSRVFFSKLPDPSELSLGVRQRIIYGNCVQKNDFRHIISTTSVTYALCLVDKGGTEGLVIGQRHEDGRLLPIRDIGHESSSGSVCMFGYCVFPD